jgi:ribosomal protein L16 Arg81 hydroxylase
MFSPVKKTLTNEATMAKVTQYANDTINAENTIDKLFEKVSEKFKEHKQLIDAVDTETLKEYVDTLIAEETTDRESADIILQNNINTNAIAIGELAVDVGSEIVERKTADNNLQNSINLKENTANKSNEIDDSLLLYPTNNAVKTELEVRDQAI